MAKAIKDNKCLVPVEYLRGTWMFNVAAGATESEAFELSGNYPDNLVVVTSPNVDNGTDITDVVIRGYVDDGNGSVTIEVTNNGSSAIDGLNVNFVVL